jgi:FtsZ-interacting cell division protein ZipA
MTDLQGGLIVLGVLAVAAVAVFNFWQVRQFRKRAQQALEQSEVDPLLGGTQPERRAEPAGSDDFGSSEPPRREPSLGGQAGTSAPIAGDPPAAAQRGASGTHEEPTRQPAEAVASIVGGAPAGLWFPIVLRAPAGVEPAALAELRAQLSAQTRSIDWDEAGGELADAEDAATGGPLLDHLLRVQVVDARGAATLEELRRLLASAQQAAQRIGGEVLAGDPASAAQAARALFEFCSSVDVAIGLNVTASGSGFAGTKLRGLIEAAGFRAMPDFSYVLADDNGTTLCTLTSGEGGGLDPQMLKSQPVHAITLQIDVPRTPGTLAQFERTVTIARQFAQALQGKVVDDSGRVLDEASIGRIRTQLSAMVKAMRAHGIEPGDAMARRVFG